MHSDMSPLLHQI
uniref:Uncharacterized protein n=1 Tax=Rhizophora mucronata TaxID=61149 RepID=A0A2P2IMU6_RHIMU